MIIKTIIKTSQEAKVEQSILKKESTCPECGKQMNMGVYYSSKKVMVGFLKTKTVRQTKYSCGECGCEWVTGLR